MPSETRSTAKYVQKPKTLTQLREGIASGKVKAANLASNYYDRIAQVNPDLNI